MQASSAKEYQYINVSTLLTIKCVYRSLDFDCENLMIALTINRFAKKSYTYSYSVIRGQPSQLIDL